MKALLLFTLCIVLSSCGPEKQSDGQWKTIEVGDFLFDFPADFELVPDQGIDSYVGKVKGDSMWFGFDFGYYSDDFMPTQQEYLEDGFWRLELPYRFMQPGITYDQNNTPKVDVLNIRKAIEKDSTVGSEVDFVARCKHEETEFDFGIHLPKEIKRTNFKIDTINNLYVKVVWAKNPQEGITGIYIRDLDGFNRSMNSYLALSMATGDLSSEQQEIALNIFRTVRRKK